MIVGIMPVVGVDERVSCPAFVLLKGNLQKKSDVVPTKSSFLDLVGTFCKLLLSDVRILGARVPTNLEK